MSDRKIGNNVSALVNGPIFPRWKMPEFFENSCIQNVSTDADFAQICY